MRKFALAAAFALPLSLAAGAALADCAGHGRVAEVPKPAPTQQTVQAPAPVATAGQGT
jgi:hypothetical protein